MLSSIQARVFGLTWLSYASFYLTRKNLSVVKSQLEATNVSLEALATIDTAYMIAYALGQFISGTLGDAFGARRILSLGMLGSALCAWAFSLGEGAAIFGVAFGLQGLCQSTGWPNNIKAMTPFFSQEVRGRVMGLWCTCYQVGGLAGTALATALMVRYGWRSAFWVPALWVASVSLLLFFTLPSASGVSDDDSKAHEEEPQVSLRTLLKEPAVWSYGGSYFSLKLIRYSLLFWLPYYLVKALGYEESIAGFLSMSFEVGGIVGAVVTGWIADRYFAKSRVMLLAPMLLGLAVALVAYQWLGHLGPIVNVATMVLVGVLIVGPEALMTGAIPQDLGGHAGAGTAAGVINGLGSLGAILQGFVTVWVSATFGWSMLFYVFIGLSVLSAAALLPVVMAHSRATV